MKKKVVILTFSRSYNYGANLQAYSLQRFIRELDVECKIIDIRSIEQRNNRIEYRKDACGRILNLFSFFHRKELSEAMRKFNSFNYSEIDRTENYYKEGAVDGIDYNRIENDARNVDVYISGSDQVFSPLLMSKLYFQNFDTQRAKCITYAASIGMATIPDNVKEEFSERLKKFNAISMREKSGQETISALTTTRVTVNIDPVFLTSMKDWILLEKQYFGVRKGQFILAYFLYRDPSMNKVLKKVHKETGLPIVVIDRNPFRGIYHQKLILDAGPQEFIWLIHHAKMVITSSFHGTAFSLIMKKDFFVFNNPKAPERIKNLLNLTGTNAHNITTVENLELSTAYLTEKEIEIIDDRIQVEVNNSKKYLLEWVKE